MEEVPRRTSLVPLASPYFLLCFSGWKQKGFETTRGGWGLISIVRWNLGPVLFGVNLSFSDKVPQHVNLIDDT